MPSGKTHDWITLVLAVPVAAFSWRFGFGLLEGSALVISTLCGGLIFGPDLDTKSTPYSRWGICRPMWYPYMKFFSHRSRWSHGLIFGTLFRVIYFLGITTLIGFLVVYFVLGIKNGGMDELLNVARNWGSVSDLVRSFAGEYIFLYVFGGLWFGAATHTMTDMAVTYIKTGRVIGFL